MQGPVQNTSHRIPPVFVLGRTTDALGDYDSVKTGTVPAKHFRDFGALTILRWLREAATVVLRNRRVSHSACASQNTFINNSNTSNAPAAMQKFISLSDKGIRVSSCVSRGVRWGHLRAWWNSTPENPNDKIVRARTKMSALSQGASAPSQICFGPSKRRPALRRLRSLTSAPRAAGFVERANRLCRLFSPSSTKCFANRPN